MRTRLPLIGLCLVALALLVVGCGGGTAKKTGSAKVGETLVFPSSTYEAKVLDVAQKTSIDMGGGNGIMPALGYAFVAVHMTEGHGAASAIRLVDGGGKVHTVVQFSTTITDNPVKEVTYVFSVPKKAIPGSRLRVVHKGATAFIQLGL